MTVNESWCIFTFCPRKGPIRGNPEKGIYICDKHWKMIHEGEADKLEAIRNAINEVGPTTAVHRIRKLLEADV